jgi:hypothetical protein
MSEYVVTLLVVSGAVAILAWLLGLKRGVFWIAILALNTVLSSLYLSLPKLYAPGVWWPPSSGVNVLLDASICLLIYAVGGGRWVTVWLYSLMLLSVAVNLLFTTGSILGWPPLPSREIYAILLEVISYLALLLILGTAILSRVGARHGHSFTGRIMGALYWAGQALLSHHEPSKALNKRH